jgi:CBS-domain-containing membrane protein
MHASLRVHRDVRTYLPPVLSRFLGYRPPAAKAPFDPMPFPPFSWLRYVPLKYEVWVLSTIGAFVGIALIEIVMATRFAGAPHGTGIVLIVASFGASAVLVYGALDAPLSQPRNLVGGQVICAFTGVWVTKVFRHAAAYEIHDTTEFGDLGHVVWLNGAFAMAFSLLLMLMTDTVHPP